MQLTQSSQIFVEDLLNSQGWEVVEEWVREQMRVRFHKLQGFQMNPSLPLEQQAVEQAVAAAELRLLKHLLSEVYEMGGRRREVVDAVNAATPEGA